MLRTASLRVRWCQQGPCNMQDLTPRSHSNEELPLPPAGDTLRPGMGKPLTIGRWLAAAAGAALLLAFALALAPGRGGVSSRPSSIDIVGSGTLAWERVAVRAKPSASAEQIAVFKQFRPDFRPNYVLALAQVKSRKAGKPTWYKVSVPGRPNGRTGWVRANSLELRPIHQRLVIYRGARRFGFWDGNKLVRSGEGAV